MKKYITVTFCLLGIALQAKAQNLIANGDFSTFTCGGASCNLTTFAAYPSASNCRAWYSLTGSPEIYTGVVAGFMWDYSGGGASESMVQVFSTPLVNGQTYSFSIDAFHNNNRGSGNLVVKLSDGTNTQTIMNVPVSNTSFQKFSVNFTANSNHTRIIIEPEAKVDIMDLVVDNADLQPATLSVSTPGSQNNGVYPNPFNEKITVQLRADQKTAIARIRDISGREIKTLSLNQAENIIDCSDLKSGTYFLILEFSDGNKAVQKMIKY